jgi:hypothetical protein
MPDLVSGSVVRVVPPVEHVVRVVPVAGPQGPPGGSLASGTAGADISAWTVLQAGVVPSVRPENNRRRDVVRDRRATRHVGRARTHHRPLMDLGTRC